MSTRQITFDRAKEIYVRKRNHPPLGVSLSTNLWMSYDPVQDCFVLKLVVSRYYEKPHSTVDAAGNPIEIPRWHRATAKERDKYTTWTLGYIYPTHALLLPPKESCRVSIAANNLFFRFFSCNYSNHTTASNSGYAWHTWRPRNPNTANIDFGRYTTTVLSGGGLVVPFDGTSRTPERNLDVVVVDNTKRKALNARIRYVRNLIKTRQKLGAFTNVDWQDRSRESFARAYYEGLILGSSKRFADALGKVDAENLDSIIEMLCLCLRRHAWPRRTASAANTDFVAEFNRHLARVRKELHKLEGVKSLAQSSG